MKISPSLIPHHLFHTGIWLQSVDKPSWYYFSEKESLNIISNHGFYETLDPELKELVKFLHENRVRTTPSCSGHNKSINDFEQVYDALISDEEKIKGKGMKLRNIETGATYLYRDDHYKLPWTKEKFLKEVLTYQRKGVLGIRTEDRKGLKEQLLKLEIKGVKVKECDHVVLILTEGSANDEQIKNTWKEVTNQVKNIISKI